MTVTSINSLNPANDPESMVAFLPNVRDNPASYFNPILTGTPIDKYHIYIYINT